MDKKRVNMSVDLRIHWFRMPDQHDIFRTKPVASTVQSVTQTLTAQTLTNRKPPLNRHPYCIQLQPLPFLWHSTHRANQIMSSGIGHVSDDTFETDVLKATKPVLVDYWAEWCGPCKMIAPVLEEISTEYGDKIDVVKLNIDENPQTPPKYGIRGIPTLMIFKNGQVEATKVGAVTKSQLAAFIDSNT
jgi:thioredoxin 1